jgi:hypothetical protein
MVRPSSSSVCSSCLITRSLPQAWEADVLRAFRGMTAIAR